MHRGHTFSHTQHELVPAKVKELGHREGAGHKVAISATGTELQAPLLAIDFQGNLWVPLCISHLKQIPCVLVGVFLEQQR